MAVPLDALDRDGGGTVVWLVDGSRVRRRPVVVAGSHAGRAILASGLEPGDRVVTTVSTRLEDGLEIGPVSEAPSP